MEHHTNFLLSTRVHFSWKTLQVLEIVSQAHDVPFGSCFEVTLYSQPGPTAQKFFDLNAQVCMEFVLALVGSITQGPKLRFM